jgi:uncharacterized DUF497 family protein
VQFEWDEAKAASNLRKHGVDFDDAMRIFLDPRRLIAEDERFDYGERRLQVLGAVDGRILFVACYLAGWRVPSDLGEEGQCARKSTL